MCVFLIRHKLLSSVLHTDLFKFNEEAVAEEASPIRCSDVDCSIHWKTADFRDR